MPVPFSPSTKNTKVHEEPETVRGPVSADAIAIDDVGFHRRCYGAMGIMAP